MLLILHTTLPLSSISMVAEGTRSNIWLIIFTLPAETGLSWGYIHLPRLFFVHFNMHQMACSSDVHMWPSAHA